MVKKSKYLKTTRNKFPGFFRKVTLFVPKLLIKLLAWPVALLIRALRPFVLVRFGPLRSERIGHLAANTELYLCERDSGMHGRCICDFFYHRMPICNRQLARMWSRVLHISFIVRWFDKANRRLPGWENHRIAVHERGDVDLDNLLEDTKPHLYFTSREEQRGRQKLQAFGIPPENGKFVCFYARDKVYTDLVIRPAEEHTARRHDYRNSLIVDYIPAMEELVRRGYFVLRMGAEVEDSLDVDEPNIIDYAAFARDDFMDIFLCAKCNFFLGSTGGLNAVPRIFRRPMAYVNFVPLGLVHLFACAPGSLLIPKKLWSREKKRFLTFCEMIEVGADRFFSGDEYEEAGIDVVENTPEEILSIAMEMDEQLKGTWSETEEDKNLQERFWELFTSRPIEKSFARINTDFLRYNRCLILSAGSAVKRPCVRIGTEFLRQNQQLLW